ncbi:MAG TPA: sigma-70 family RNA polymerase sigma factor [Candidatus Limnocylindria bacterium]|jgi:RNA polymerase sigma-70 factor (ECF subfamily)|nr:sigma-70 family RNA polymerase sigma factor [Candidatus Limnocylindria bacterium]
MLGGEPNDDMLAQRVAQGDVAAFATLYDRYARRIYAWAAHVVGSAEAEDVVQEVFVRLWDKAAQFDARRGRFAWWFIAVARHHLMSQLRRRTLQQRIVAADEIERLLADVADRDAGPEDLAGSREDTEEIRRALATLPDEQRRVLVLAYFAGLTQSEIARHTGTPLGTVKKRTRLALQKLRERMTDERGSRLRGAG